MNQYIKSGYNERQKNNERKKFKSVVYNTLGALAALTFFGYVGMNLPVKTVEKTTVDIEQGSNLSTEVIESLHNYDNEHGTDYSSKISKQEFNDETYEADRHNQENHFYDRGNHLATKEGDKFDVKVTSSLNGERVRLDVEPSNTDSEVAQSSK